DGASRRQDRAGPRRRGGDGASPGARMSAPPGGGSGGPAAAPHLEIRALAIRYGAIRAVHDVSLEVGHDEIVTLVGSNGAGKSSTLNAVAGLVRPAAGEIRLAGDRVDGARPWELVARGVSLTPEGRQVFPRFTVEENLAVGAYSRRDRATVETDLE